MSEPQDVIPFDRLPEGFAETLEKPPAVPATPRPAATVVLMRDADKGLEVLLMRRTRSAGFVPGAWVFPGGRVDETDGSDAAAERVDGLSRADAAARLDLEDDPAAALAYYLAALREAFEETGILVARDAGGLPPATALDDDAVDALREELLADRLDFAGVLDRVGCRVDGAAVEYLAHWITPEPEPRRYDTRFFAAAVPAGCGPVVDVREMTDAVWIGPAEALERNRQGTLPMVFPTLKTLERLCRYGSVDEALEALRKRRVPTIVPRLVVTPTGVGMELDAEP